MKSFLHLAICLLFASCSTMRTPSTRAPADVESSSCSDLAKSLFMSENYEKDLSKALIDKKLVTFKEKIMQIHYPRLEWMNKVKISFNQSLRNWNNNRYPAFYIFNDEEVIPTAKRYAENIEKIVADQIAAEDDETTKAYLAVNDWIKAFSNYKSELDQLIEERISLQYNISLLKKLKLEDGESRDIQITVKRNGVLQTEVITLRSEDKNLQFTINKLKEEMAQLDGTLIRNGKIKDRVVRQAMLLDMLTIVHRELDYAVKNSSQPSAEAMRALDKLSSLIKEADYSPSTYGIFKIQDKVFIRELIALSKLDVAYDKIKTPLIRFKTILSDYFKNRNAGTDQEKVGFFKRMYAKITSITPKQATIGAGSVVLAGIGYERYFWFKKQDTVEQPEGDRSNQMGPEAEAHKEQLEQSKKVETEKHESQSHVVEVQIDSLIKN